MDRRKIVELELTLGRTPDGRHIGDSLMEKIDSYLKEGSTSGDFTRCKLCGFQMASDIFLNGCPNCGCKDIETLETRGGAGQPALKPGE